MPRSLSTYLDLLRFTAACAVFGGHLATNPQWVGFQNDAFLIQNDAVIGFFVLSGTVIGYVSEQKVTGWIASCERGWPDYGPLLFRRCC